jgi:Ca2+-transporting ATPase
VTGAEGLTSPEAHRLLVEHGGNELPSEPGPTVAGRVAHQLRDPMILLLCGALVLVVAVGDWADATIIAAVVVLNTTIGVVQDLRAQHAVDALSRVAAPVARVWRDGALVALPAAEIVPGDLVRLEAGDVVPADLLLVEAQALEMDESTMTGESVPVRHEPEDEALSGTVVTKGRALGRVVRTGADSALGQVAAMVSGRVRPTPLQRRLGTFSRQLVVVTGALCLVVLGLALAQGESWTQAAVLAVSLGVAAVPESLPAVVTISLALGAHRMARHHAVVRRLPAVETLGSVSVLASDKTGTMTPGVLTVRRLWTPAGTVEVTGTAYTVAGSVVGEEPARCAATRLLRDSALCNDAVISPGPAGQWTPTGDPFDVALLVAAAKVGLTVETLRGWHRVEESPFDSDQGYARTVHADGDGTLLEVVKGAPETVLGLLPAGPSLEAARAQLQLMAQDGHRVLALVENRDFVGLIAVSDPPHPQAAGVVERCRAAGVRTVLITGDHPATAAAVAKQIGVLRDGEVVEGLVVDRGEHAGRVESIDVYSRTRPHQKVAIVEAWQATGAVVAMTGDGVNDAPALRRADIGVAMGGRGTEVARQAADLVLVDDNLETLVDAVAEGRRIHANIRRFLRYGLAGGLAEVLVLLCAPLAGLPVPLTPAMILWVNMVTHGLPGVAFGGEPLDERVMTRPPPAPTRSVLDRRLTLQVAQGGLLVAATSLVAGWWAQAHGTHVQTAVFLTLGLGQLAVALALRAPRSRGWHPRERGLELAVLVAVLAQLGGALVPGLDGLLGATPPAAQDLLVFLGLGAVPGLAIGVAGRVPRPGRRS